LNEVSLSTGLIESDDPKEALKGFQEVVSMEAEKGEWYPHSSQAAPSNIIACSFWVCDLHVSRAIVYLFGEAGMNHGLQLAGDLRH
jgi:hypothetical protein